MRTSGRLLGVGGLVVLAYFAGLMLQAPALRLVVKPVPVLCLTAMVLVERRDAYGRLIGAGLLLSSLGDVLLELPGRFVPGLAAFLAAHLAYTSAFVSQTRALSLLRALPFVAYGLAVYLWLRPGLGAMAVPVGLYTLAITAMMWRAAARVGDRTAPGGRIALAGAIAFALSDTLIAFDRFHASIAGVRVPIMLLYWAGQLGLALSARPVLPAPAHAPSHG
jgi:uncharacterized membrane protein YhhN